MIGTDFRSFEIYLHRGAVDFRKGIDGLAAIAESEMRLSPFEKPRLFVFASRNRKRLKILYWDRTGFALWMKRLDEAQFPWPRKALEDRGEQVLKFTARELEWLLEGYEFWRLTPHSKLSYERVA